MKSVIKAIVFFVMGLTVIFYGGAYMLPGEVRVERSLVISAPPGKVYGIAADLRRVPEWSPWPALDPQTRFTFEGAAAGAGQVMRWASNNPMVGSGTQTLVEAVPDQRLAFRNDYVEFGSSTASMVFTPAEGGTRVTWVFQSALPGVVDRWAGIGIDSQVGAEYEAGLANLKSLAEHN